MDTYIERKGYPDASASKVTYHSVIDSKGKLIEFSLNSDTFTYFFNYAVTGCKKGKNAKACQSLANLCVLQLYEYSGESACKYFKEQLMAEENDTVDQMRPFGDPGWKEGLPWLYYEATTKKTLKRRP